MHTTQSTKLRIVTPDPLMTTNDRTTTHLQQSCAVTQIAAALASIGVVPEVAHEHAIACVQRVNPEMVPIATFHIAEALWRMSVGDLDGVRSMVGYGLSAEPCRKQVAKVLADVREVMHTEHAAFSGQMTEHERVRAATHWGQWLAGQPSDVQAQADAVVRRMALVESHRGDV